MMPFDALKLPLDENLINVADFIKEYGTAERKLSKLCEILNKNNTMRSYSLNHLLKTESFYSTKIEGTHTTIDEIYEASTNSINAKRSADVQEVFRYNEALHNGIKLIQKEKLITNKVIRQLHKILLSGEIRKNSNFQAGEFRHQQNKVGDHIPPKAIDVADLMGNLERYMNDDAYDYQDLPALVKIAIIHAQFETIHPFPDGNGRVGRVLIPLYLYMQNEIETPYFFISQELERNKQKYYNYLQGTRKKNTEGFSKWIKFFLESISKQCDRDIEFIEQLELLRLRVLDKLKSEVNSINIDKVVTSLFANPIFTCKMLSDETGIKETTMRKYIQKMIDLEIIFTSQQKRNIRYYFADLLDIIRD